MIISFLKPRGKIRKWIGDLIGMGIVIFIPTTYLFITKKDWGYLLPAILIMFMIFSGVIALELFGKFLEHLKATKKEDKIKNYEKN